MINFIDTKIENEPIHERNARVDRMMNAIVWGNTRGYMGDMQKYPDTFLSDKEQQTNENTF